MFLLESSAASLLAGLTAALLLGLWVITYKASKFRFEFYYLDFCAGFLLLSALAFGTLGTFGVGVTSMDNLAIVKSRLVIMAVAAGAATTLGVLLQLAFASLAGIALSFLITCSLALAVHYLQFVLLLGRGVAVFAFGSALLALIAAGIAIAAYSAYVTELGASSTVPANAKAGAQVRQTAGLGIAFGVGGGVILGLLFFVLRLARIGDIEMQPYPIALFGGIGALLAAPIYDLFFMNLSVHSSSPPRIGRFFKASARQHLFGLAGGLIFGAGYLLLLLAMYGENPEAHLRSVQASFCAYGGAIPAALYGIVVLKELRSSRGLILAYLSILVFAAALGLSLFAE
ncbi:MAG: hypothetical protein R2762_28110 [Bryobacteraceae bacterium]